ncbi:Disease resistance protein [Macleaya cordata]|uniref:Disease resistance protein n=1 Tax=Macleaya cordata TaxID=56857 RepID=A0A200R789_MACCD|nr:Disease resistance protein [Macleaya cordata]
MACSLIEGAGVGAVVSEVLKVVIEAIHTASSCKSLLEQLKSTLVRIIPRIDEIKRLGAERTDRQITDLSELDSELKKGEVIVRKCSKVECWNYYKKYRYAKKILKLDAYLVRFFQLDVNLEIWCDTKRILVDVQESNRKLDRLEERGSSGSLFRSGFGSFRAIPEIPSLTVGLSVPLKELKMELFRDDVTVLGLCAPGGCGKTTLAAMLCQDAEVKGKFKENVFFLTISSSPNLREILQRLFEQMDSGYRVPEFQNDEDAVNYLGCLLKQREQEPTLLVLDDVWSESFLRKFVFRTVRYKMLVTSRTAFPTFDSTYSLKMLTESDAITLFNHIVFPQDAKSERPNEDLVYKIVRGCKGFPLAVSVIAHSLHRKPARKWTSTEKTLSKGSSIFDAHEDLLQCLATSLGFLDDDVRECFLDLGCFPEDQRIPAAALIDIWVELYEQYDEDDAYVNLLELSTRNLVNLVESTRKDAGGIDGSFNELFVVQHDLLRDLAIHQSRGNQNIKQSKRLMMDRREDNLPKSWRDHEDQAFNARFVSINTGELFSSERCKVQFPLAQVLMLNLSAKNCTLPQFMEKMGELKVLIIANQGPHHASLCGLPALGYYLSHLKRIRLERVSVPSVNEITEPFKNLQKISLVMCEVSHALKNCNINIPSMLPNLTEIDIDYCDDMMELPQEICMISYLQKLSITNCHNLSAISESIGQMTSLEVLRLHACTGLLELPHSIRTLGKLSFLDISDCCNLERMPSGMGELSCLRKLDMRRCSRVRRLPTSVMNLKCLKDIICDEEMSIQWEHYQVHLPQLNIRVPKDDINLNWLGFDLTNKFFCS